MILQLDHTFQLLFAWRTIRYQRQGNIMNRKAKFSPKYRAIIGLLIAIATVQLIYLLALYVRYDHQRYFSEVSALIDSDKCYPGVYINDIDVSCKDPNDLKSTMLRELYCQKPEKISISVVCDGKTMPLTENDFKCEFVNMDDVVSDVYKLARHGDLNRRYDRILSLRKYPVRMHMDSRLDITAFEEVISKIESEFNVPSKSACVSFFDPNSENVFSYSDGQDGLVVDTKYLKQQLVDALKSGTHQTINLSIRKVKNNVTVDSLKKHTLLIGEFQTESTAIPESNHNMQLAFESISGTIIKSGEIFSFNGSTGNTNDKNLGYVPAPAIVSGSIALSYGGGICQAATTIYGAAIRANMEIIERHNHLWKSKYIPYGLDATISYGYLDLKFRNNSKNPVYIATSMKDKTLICKIYGSKNPDFDKIDVNSWITEEDHANNKVKVEAERIFFKNNAEVKREPLPKSFYKIY